MTIETLISLGYYVSSVGFLVATILSGLAAQKLGKSAFGSIFSYFFIGTGVFFVITIFQKLGGEFFAISDESMDVWWHVMFYLALLSYFFGFRALVGLASGDSEGQGKAIGMEKKWGLLALVILVVVFLIPSSVETTVLRYDSSALGQLGLHHFLAFILAGVVGSYLFSIKKNIGQIGRAVAGPMIVAIWALALQHFWELLTESWAVFTLTSDNIEGVEKIFLTISAFCVISAVLRLKSFSKG